MPTPKDKQLYDKIKKEITDNYKPSAYRSGMIVRRYKSEYEKKHKSKDAYFGSKEGSNLKRWFNEVWVNQRGEVGYKYPSDVYRPTFRINSKTPKTFDELTLDEINRARREKQTKGRVKRF